MGKLLGDTAINTAATTVRAALEGGSLKLLGPHTQASAEANAKADAKYLATLFNEVYDQIRAQQP
jgi:hypothetical protein